jgi:hypothetical protein
MLGSRPVRYFSVAARTASDALRLVEEYLNGANGQYAIARADGVSERPGIVTEAQVAA